VYCGQKGTKDKDLMIGKRSKTKLWVSQSDQRERYNNENAIKGKGMVIKKRSKAKVW
jgi:hypothetical protein